MLGAGLFPLQDVHVALGSTSSANPDPRAGGPRGPGQSREQCPLLVVPIAGDDTGPPRAVGHHQPHGLSSGPGEIRVRVLL